MLSCAARGTDGGTGFDGERDRRALFVGQADIQGRPLLALAMFVLAGSLSQQWSGRATATVARRATPGRPAR